MQKGVFFKAVGNHFYDVPRVLIRVHDVVRQQRYIDVINCLASAGIHDIALLNEVVANERFL